MNATGNDASIRHCFVRMSQVQWALTAITLLAVVALVAPSPMRIEHPETSINVLVGAVFGTVALVYTYLRFDLMVATFCDTVAQLCLFVMIGGTASYVAAHYGAGTPFRDDYLLAIDHAFGMDWRAYLRAAAAHPQVTAVLDTAYGSILWQATGLVVVLTATGRSARLQSFILAFQASSVISIVVSALVPALGAYPHLQISQTLDHPGLTLSTMNSHVATLMQLRGDAPVVPLSGVEGIVTFPSMHMALAVLFVWGFWSVPMLRWPALGLNLLMILSTPLSGGHYFVDLAGGAAVAATALAATAAVRRRVERVAAERNGAGREAPDVVVPSPALAA